MPNLLIVGTTNRRDLMDEALLRPGRFDVHLEIGLPDLEGRAQIFEIHTQEMAKHQHLDEDVDIIKLAELAESFTGAEIEGLVKGAASHAMSRMLEQALNSAAHMDTMELIKQGNMRIRNEDFEKSLAGIEPANKKVEDIWQKYMPNGIIVYSKEMHEIVDVLTSSCDMLLPMDRPALPTSDSKVIYAHHFKENLKSAKESETKGSGASHSENTPRDETNQHGDNQLSLLMHGPRGSGKSALAAFTALYGRFEESILITADEMIGKNVEEKTTYIISEFDKALKHSSAIVVFDDIEALFGELNVLICSAQVPRCESYLFYFSVEVAHVGGARSWTHQQFTTI